MSFKAIACGADLVAIGPPMIYGLALGGATGVQQVFDFFKKRNWRWSCSLRGRKRWQILKSLFTGQIAIYK